MSCGLFPGMMRTEDSVRFSLHLAVFLRLRVQVKILWNGKTQSRYFPRAFLRWISTRALTFTRFTLKRVLQVFRKLKVPKDIYFIRFGGCNHYIYTYIYIHCIYNAQIQFSFVWIKPKNRAALFVKFLLLLLVPIQCQGIIISCFGKPQFCKWLKVS